jgi:hypothetical protein
MSVGILPFGTPALSACAIAPAIRVSASFLSVGPLLLPPDAVAS